MAGTWCTWYTLPRIKLFGTWVYCCLNWCLVFTELHTHTFWCTRVDYGPEWTGIQIEWVQVTLPRQPCWGLGMLHLGWWITYTLTQVPWTFQQPCCRKWSPAASKWDRLLRRLTQDLESQLCVVDKDLEMLLVLNVPNSGLSLDRLV